MDIHEEAIAYAKEQINSIISEAIVKVYTDGYRAGYHARSKEIENQNAIEASRKSIEEIEIKKPVVNDMGLPSQTLWTDFLEEKNQNFPSSHNLVEMRFREAKKHFGQKLPTLQDWQELNKECQFTADSSGHSFSFLSAEGQRYYMRSTFFRIKENTYHGVAFWLFGEETPEKMAKCVIMYYDRNEKVLHKSIESVFVGESLPVILAYTVS